MKRALFSAYTRRRLARELDGVWISGLDALRAELAVGPLVLALTHVSWWDGVVLAQLDDALGRPGRVLMDAANLADVPYLRGLGVIPLDRTSPARMRAGMREAVDWLTGPGRAVFVFAQGRQRPHHLRPLGLQRGHELLMRASGARLVPIALGYGFRDASVPAAVIACRSPVGAESLEEGLVAGLAAVDRFLDRGVGDFAALVPSRHVRSDHTLRGRLLETLTRRRLPTGRRAVVVGAGLGGLSAAIRLASRGFAVELCEASDRPGGKAGTAEVDGVRFDTGPSVLTLPDRFDRAFRDAGTSLRDEVELIAADPAFRYHWPDGTALDVHVDPDRTLASVERTLGSAARAELAGFLTYAARIWTAAEPRFVAGPAPRPIALLSLAALRDLAAIDPLRTMARAIEARVRDPHLRDVLLRYATYNGSDPRRAPATLNCIAHVELGLGGFGVAGGVQALIAALVRAADRVGVRIRLGERVERIRVDGGRVRGVWTGDRELPADVVISNAEPTQTLGALGRSAPVPTSTSGWTAVARATSAAEGGQDRVAHQVWFPADYRQEFADLFDRERVPADPAIYACAQAVAHRAPGWPDAEPVFVMVNAPAGHDADWVELEDRVHRRLVGMGALAASDRFVWRRTPMELAAAFPGSRGALYGAASHGLGAAFRRPANRVPGVSGLFLAGGSAHPGGGMPLCVASGQAAADAALEER